MRKFRSVELGVVTPECVINLSVIRSSFAIHRKLRPNQIWFEAPPVFYIGQGF